LPAAYDFVTAALKISPGREPSIRLKLQILTQQQRKIEQQAQEMIAEQRASDALAFLEGHKQNLPQDSFNHLKAQALLAAGDLPAAYNFVTAALKISPDREPSIRLKLQILTQQQRKIEQQAREMIAEQRSPDALAFLEGHKQNLPQDSFNHLKAQALLAAGDLPAAYDFVTAALKISPDREPSIRLKLQILARQGRFHDAYDLARLAENEGNLSDPSIVLQHGFRAQIATSELLAHATAYVAQRPDHIATLKQQYRFLTLEKKYSQALEVVQQVTAKKPGQEWAWIATARMVALLEDVDGKEALANDMRRQDNLSPKLRGRVLAILQLYDEAEACLISAYEGLDGEADILDVLAEIKMAKGDYHFLRPLLDEARLENPRLATFAIALSQAHAALGNDPDGKDSLTELVASLMPDTSMMKPRKGHVLHIGGGLLTGGAEKQMVSTATETINNSDEWVSELCCNVIKDHGNGLYDALIDNQIKMTELKSAPQYQRLRELMAEDVRHVQAVRRMGALPPSISSDVMLCYSAIIDHGPEVVHCWQDALNLIGGLAAMAAGVPRIVLTGRRSIRAEKRNERPELASLLKGLLMQPHVKLWCNARYGADSYAKWLSIDPKGIGVIQNGYNFNVIDDRLSNAPPRADIRAAAGFEPEHIVMGNVARMVPFKRQDLWLETLAHLVQTTPQVRGLIVGHGMLDKKLRAQAAELDILDKIYFAGEQSPAEPWMSAMDIFVYTASPDGDGLPNVLIEAQATGCPVASTQAGGAFDTFVEGKTGLALTGDAPTDWAQQLAQTISRPNQLQQMGRAAYDHARATFSTAQMMKASINAWNDKAENTL
jgi:glycosyltransferase involved in cell wall biosynthesis